MKIILKDIELYGYHGVHELEKKVGVSFLVNMCMNIDIDQPDISLDETIDYAIVLSILKVEFNQPSSLLESLAIRIAASVKLTFPQLLGISINIMKIGAPIENFLGCVGIEYEKSYS